MKAKKITLYIFMFLPFVATLILLPFLPEQIPAHYNFHNQVTRWGSKYEALISPVVTVLFGFFMLGMARYSAKQKQQGKNNENVCLVAGIATLVLFNALTAYTLYLHFNQIENLSFAAFDISKLLFGIFGAAMIVLGNIMPKLRMNAIIGLRTTWSMKNETTWKKSQRFGGITFMIAGVMIVAVSCLTTGFACFLWAMGILLVLQLLMFCILTKLRKSIKSADMKSMRELFR